ncbi:uncharacterized protein V6R79_022924 [Siganus canaliculatus]
MMKTHFISDRFSKFCSFEEENVMMMVDDLHRGKQTLEQEVKETVLSRKTAEDGTTVTTATESVPTDQLD